MKDFKTNFNDGTGELNIQYEGTAGTTGASVTSDCNCGEDRTTQVAIATDDGGASKNVIINQEGVREQFIPSDQTEGIRGSDGELFLGIKEKFAGANIPDCCGPSIIWFDKTVSDPANITGSVNSGEIANILSKFRRCLCKNTGDGEVTIAYLKNDDSNFYDDVTVANLDGTEGDVMVYSPDYPYAQLDGTEGDVMVYFPQFWYKWHKKDENIFGYEFSESPIEGGQRVKASLVGAYKAVVVHGLVYSQSGVTPTTNVSQADFLAYSEARGQGYQIIDFQQHCVIAFMLYAKYGNRNLQAVLGTGGATYNPATTTGSSNATGNADTKNESSKYVCGLGLEGVFGGINEYVKGVEINNYVWKISDPDGSTREVNAGTSGGYIKNIAAETGPFFDMVPTGVGGSYNTYYSDNYSRKIGGPFVLARSSYDSSTHGGVAYANAVRGASDTNSYYGSRLAFRGVINQAKSIDEFKKLPLDPWGPL